MSSRPELNFLDRDVSANWPSTPIRVDHWWFVKPGAELIPWSLTTADTTSKPPEKLLKSVAWEQEPGDTLTVQLKARKRVYYFNGYVTAVISYHDFKREFFPYYKRMKKGMKGYWKEKNSGGTVNTDWEKYMPALDSFYASAVRQAASSEKIQLYERDLTQVGLGGLHLDRFIEKGRCLIVDHHDHIQHIIIRKRFGHQEGPLEGAGGRKYYLPGNKTPFCVGIDWIS